MQRSYVWLSSTCLWPALEGLLISAFQWCGYFQTECEENFFTFNQRRLWGDFIAAFHYVKGAYKKDEEDVLPGLVLTGQGATVLN